MSHFSGEDLIFYKDTNSGQIMSGGYLIDSIMLKNGISPMTTYNYKGGFKDKGDDEDKVSSIFENLAVPAGLFYMNERTPLIDSCEFQQVDSLSDDIHERLLAFVEVSIKKPKVQSRKYKSNVSVNKNKKSHKNKR